MADERDLSGEKCFYFSLSLFWLKQWPLNSSSSGSTFATLPKNKEQTQRSSSKEEKKRTAKAAKIRAILHARFPFFSLPPLGRERGSALRRQQLLCARLSSSGAIQAGAGIGAGAPAGKWPPRRAEPANRRARWGHLGARLLSRAEPNRQRESGPAFIVGRRLLCGCVLRDCFRRK